MDGLGVAQMRGDLVRIQCGGHHQQPQVRPERPPHLKRKRKAQVAGKRPFVEFVEDDEPDILKLGIGKKPLREQALSNDLKSRPFADPALKPHLVADCPADRLAQLRRDELRTSAGCEAARLEHHDLAALKPRLVQKRRWHACRLSAAWGRSQNDITVAGERRPYFADLLLYRKHRSVSPEP